MPEQDLINLLILICVYIILFTITEIFYLRKKVDAEYTRKFIHIISGLISMSFVLLFQTILPVLTLSGGFAILLYVSKYYKFLKSIHGIKRSSQGSILFPIVISICFYAYLEIDNPIYYYLPLILMILSDPIAALAGFLYPIKKYKNGSEFKSMGGTSAFFISATILSILFISRFSELDLWQTAGFSLIIGGVSATVEGLSKKGFDNLLIPVSTIIVLYILHI